LLCQEFPNACTVMLRPNRCRADDLATTPAKASVAPSVPVSKEEEEDNETAKSDGASDSDEDMVGDPELELLAIHHDIEQRLGSRERNLRVRGFTLMYDVKTVYGHRDACAPGLLITSKHASANVAWSSDLWRCRLTKPATMLPRDQMIKPLRRNKCGIVTGANFTDTQERKQFHSGSDVVRTILEGLVGTTDPVILVDLHGYDGSPASAILQRTVSPQAKPCFAAAIAHDPSTGAAGSDTMGNMIFDMAKKGQLKLPGFPDFNPVVRELASEPAVPDNSVFKVTHHLASGELVVLRAHMKWLNMPACSEKMRDVLKAHNGEFNVKELTDGDTPGSQEQDAPGTIKTGEPLVKRMRVPDSEVKNVASFLKKHPDMCPAPSACNVHVANWQAV